MPFSAVLIFPQVSSFQSGLHNKHPSCSKQSQFVEIGRHKKGARMVNIGQDKPGKSWRRKWI